jgi:hypothetical protein
VTAQFLDVANDAEPGVYIVRAAHRNPFQNPPPQHMNKEQ